MTDWVRGKKQGFGKGKWFMDEERRVYEERKYGEGREDRVNSEFLKEMNGCPSREADLRIKAHCQEKVRNVWEMWINSDS